MTTPRRRGGVTKRPEYFGGRLQYIKRLSLAEVKKKKNTYVSVN